MSPSIGYWDQWKTVSSNWKPSVELSRARHAARVQGRMARDKGTRKNRLATRICACVGAVDSSTTNS